MWVWCGFILGYCRDKMVKKPIILLFGASSGIASELLKLFKKKFIIYAFYNKTKISTKLNCKKIKINLFKNKEILSKLKNINFKNHKIILINFASIKIDKLSLYINDKDLSQTFQINTFSFLKILQILLPKMIKSKWGRIINISSTGGLIGDKGTLLYSTSKNASLSMMNVMSQEYAVYNITFNTLILGNFNFGLYKNLSKDIKNKIINKIPSKKTGKIINIYNAIKFLVESDYVNGASIKIDGGYQT